MPNFRYQAVDQSGAVIHGTVIGLDESDVERGLNRSGLTLIRSRVLKEKSMSRWTGRAVNSRTLVEFYHRLAQTLEIGLPILSALEENGRYLPSKPMRQVSAELKLAVEGGHSLHEAMQTHARIFQRLDLNVVRMGEQTGVLPSCLKQLAGFLQWKENLRSHIRKAAIYPSFVMITIGAVMGVWIGYVLPQMVKMLSEMGVTVPRATVMVLDLGNWLKAYSVWIAVAAVIGVLAIYLWQRTENGGIRFDRMLLKVPLLGSVMQNIALSRLGHNFVTMFNAGIAIQTIFTLVSEHGLGNRYLEERLRTALQTIEAGESIATALEMAGGFPTLLVGAIRNGENTGTLDSAFKRLGDYFDAEVQRTVQALLSAMEPITIILLGAVFGLIVLSVLLPLYDVMGSLGKAY